MRAPSRAYGTGSPRRRPMRFANREIGQHSRGRLSAASSGCIARTLIWINARSTATGNGHQPMFGTPMVADKDSPACRPAPCVQHRCGARGSVRGSRVVAECRPRVCHRVAPHRREQLLGEGFQVNLMGVAGVGTRPQKRPSKSPATALTLRRRKQRADQAHCRSGVRQKLACRVVDRHVKVAYEMPLCVQ